MKWLLVLIAVLVVRPVSANDYEGMPAAVRAICYAGRIGRPIDDVASNMNTRVEDMAPEFRNVWEGCRQETVKDLSCYPFTIDGDRRTIFMPGNAPPDAKYEPWTADCKGRLGRWPSWSPAKEDPNETIRMGAFYFLNPPGELPSPRH